jgi:hypothetical protein
VDVEDTVSTILLGVDIVTTLVSTGTTVVFGLPVKLVPKLEFISGDRLVGGCCSQVVIIAGCIVAVLTGGGVTFADVIVFCVTVLTTVLVADAFAAAGSTVGDMVESVLAFVTLIGGFTAVMATPGLSCAVLDNDEVDLTTVTLVSEAIAVVLTVVFMVLSGSDRLSETVLTLPLGVSGTHVFSGVLAPDETVTTVLFLSFWPMFSPTCGVGNCPPC